MCCGLLRVCYDWVLRCMGVLREQECGSVTTVCGFVMKLLVGYDAIEVVYNTIGIL